MKIFTEYKILTGYQPQYVRFISQLLQLYANVKVYEGVGQPGLFVEEWCDCSETFFAQLKVERTVHDHPLWSQLNTIVEGGQAKVNMWLFKEI